MNLTPGPYLWRMRPEDEWRVVEVIDAGQGAMLCMTGSSYMHRPAASHEFMRLVPAEEVEKAWDEGYDTGAGNKSVPWERSRARRVAEGEEP